MIAKIVIQIERLDGNRITYIEKSDTFYEKTIIERKHKCRIKETIYGGLFTYYDDEMDFGNSFIAGSKIIIDTRL
jgi:hypothetical protein